MGIETAKAILKRLGIKYVAEKKVTYYCVQVGAYLLKANANNMLNKLKKAGFTGYVTKVGLYHKVQVGAFKDKANANKMLKNLSAKGFQGYITTK